MTPWKIRKNYVFIHLTPLLRNYRFFGVSYMANIVPRNATGHGRGGEIAAQSVPLAAFFQPLRPSDTSPIFCCAKHRGGVHFV